MIKAENSTIKLLVLFITLFIALTPVLFYRFFPTVDGPAHLYNAHILREFFTGDREFYSQFFQLNPVPVPNWTGHAIAVLAGYFLPVWMTEKIIILIITITFPFGIAYLGKTYGGNWTWQMLLVLPFAYTITLYLGFFNFMIALSLMLLLLAMLRSGAFNNGIFGLITMTLLASIIYFSHLMVFLLTFGLTALEILRYSGKSGFTEMISGKSLIRLLAFIPGLLLSLWFFDERGVTGFKNTIDVLPATQLWKWIAEGSPLVGLNGEKEVPFTSVFMYGLALLLAGILLMRLLKKTGFHASDILLLFAVVMAVLYFIVPDGIASGGFVSLRLLLLLLVFVTAWIIAQPLPLFISIAAGALGVFVSYSTLGYRHEVTSQLSENAGNMMLVAGKLEEKSVLLPLNYSDNWLHINLSNYIGAARKVMVLDNYEAVLNEFPVKWKAYKAPGSLAGNFAQSLNPFVTIENYETVTGTKVNYVTRWQFVNDDNDGIKTVTDTYLRQKFSNTIKVGNCDIFLKK